MIPALRLTILMLCVPAAGATAAQTPPRPPAAPRAAELPPAPRTPSARPAPRPPVPAEWPDTPRPDAWHDFEFRSPKFHLERPEMHFDTPKFELPDMSFHTSKFEMKMDELAWRSLEIDEHMSSLTRELDVWTPRPPLEPSMKFALPPTPPEPAYWGDRFPTPKPSLEPSRREPFATTPRAPWIQADSADSLYKAAYELLNRGEWRRAASAFAAIPQRFPTSGYAADALYWQAFSLYRIGGTEDLQAALRSLETMRAKYPQAKTQSDAAALTTRIRGALASRGDRTAERAIRETVTEQGQATCDREDQAVRSEALKALVQTDPTALIPSVRRVLARKDACSAPLRRTAVYLLGQSGDSEAPALLREVALNDSTSEVRGTAIQYLARSPNDIAVNTLEELLRTSTDQSVLRTAARALASNPNPRAKQAVRALIERADAPERLRIEAIGGFENSERTTDDDANYLRSVYPKIDNPRVKARIARVLGQLGGEANDQWLLGLMRNNDEPLEVRTAALSRVASRNMPIGDAVKLYGTVSDRQMREQLINVYVQRREPEATDKLLDIAKNDTDYNLRRQAINALTRKNDPRATKLLLEIIDK